MVSGEDFPMKVVNPLIFIYIHLMSDELIISGIILSVLPIDYKMDSKSSFWVKHAAMMCHENHEISS